MKRIQLVVVTVLIIRSTTFAHSSSNGPTSVPSSTWGEWKVIRFVEVGGHAGETPDKAKSETGKTITFSSSSVEYTSPFLFFDESGCKGPQYSLKVAKHKEYEVVERGTLDYYGLETPSKNQSKELVISCSGPPSYFFEYALHNELAIYFDGWFFYLSKSK